MAGDSTALFWSHSGKYQWESRAIGTYHGITILGTHSHIQQQQLSGPVTEPLESMESVGGGDEGVDKYRSNSVGAGYAI